jgi:lactobin A/cerein 7B family class IIb bacteriocin
MRTISTEQLVNVNGGAAKGVSAGLCLVAAFINPIAAGVCGAAFVSDTFFGTSFVNF